MQDSLLSPAGSDPQQRDTEAIGALRALCDLGPGAHWTPAVIEAAGRLVAENLCTNRYGGLCAWLERRQEFSIAGIARDAPTAIAMAKELDPGIVLLDLHLPGSSGIKDTLTELRGLGRKVVVFSADNRQHLVRLVFNSGAQAFVSKIESFDTLVNIIKQVIDGGEKLASPSINYRQHWLTPAEVQILNMLAKGLKYEEIAAQRDSAPQTVRKQCEKLQIKLRLRNREALIVWAVEQGYGKE